MNAFHQTSSFEQWLFRVPRLLINETLRAKCVLTRKNRETTNGNIVCIRITMLLWYWCKFLINSRNEAYSSLCTHWKFMMDSTLQIYQILLDDGWQPCVRVKISQINGTPGTPWKFDDTQACPFFKGVWSFPKDGVISDNIWLWNFKGVSRVSCRCFSFFGNNNSLSRRSRGSLTAQIAPQIKRSPCMIQGSLLKGVEWLLESTQIFLIIAFNLNYSSMKQQFELDVFLPT